MTERKDGSRRTWMDPDDAPEWADDAFSRAELRKGDKVVRAASGTLTKRGRAGSKDILRKAVGA